MKIQRLLAVANKEMIHVLRDWRSLIMAIAIPMFMLFLYGFALTFDLDNVPLAIWDQSKTPESRELIQQFEGSRYFSTTGLIFDNYREMNKLIDQRDALLALVIPVEYPRKLKRGFPSPVQLIADGSDSNTATIALGYADSIIETYSRQLKEIQLLRQGTLNLPSPLQLEPRVWYNEDLESRNNIVPGLIAVIMMVIAALLTSLTIAREWEQGTMEQLISTPIQIPELIIGKLIPYFLIGMLDVFVAFMMGKYLFDVPFRGNAGFMFSMGALFLLGALSLGMVISIVAKGQLVASQFAMILTLMPSFLLSGFFASIANMPEAIQAITYLVPARYFITMLKGIYLKGVGLEILYPQVIFLSVFSLSMFVLANVLFKKKLV